MGPSTQIPALEMKVFIPDDLNSLRKKEKLEIDKYKPSQNSTEKFLEPLTTVLSPKI